jgi:hypothetical protein
MNPDELRRLQPRLQRIHRLPQESGFTTGVQTNIVLGGFDHLPGEMRSVHLDADVRRVVERAEERVAGRLLSLGLRFFFPTRESTAASKTRETRSQQPPHAISTGSLMLQHGSVF